MIATKRTILGLWAAILLIGCGGNLDQPGDIGVEQRSSALTTIATKSLLITSPTITQDPSRTKDPCGAVPGDENRVWSFGHMIKREAEKNGIAPSTYTSALMNAWRGTATINGQSVPPLLGPVVAGWWTMFAGGNTTFPLHKAPFFLIAMTSRFDLRAHRAGGEPLGGEVHFVFATLGAAQNNPACPTVMYSPVTTVIFEYSPAKADENQVRDYARRWLDLSNLSGSAYLTALQNLTEEVINSGKLLRIRTNEGPETGKQGPPATGSTGWDLAEFEPNPSTKLLQRTTIKQTPTMDLAGNNSQQLSDWIWGQRDALYANAFDYEIGRIGVRSVTMLPIANYSVPDKFPGTQTWFRGSINHVASSGTEYWSGPQPTGLPAGSEGDWSDARFRFSVGTCRGCHGSDTGTAFNHIRANEPGAEPHLSDFLLGSVDVPDPITGSSRSFNEMFRRENDLVALVNGSPVMLPVFANNYVVRFRNANKCMDSFGNTTNDNAAAVIYGCSGNANQRLSLVSAGGGYYNLKFKHSGKCLDIQNGSTQSGAAAVQLTCNSGSNSQKLTLDTLWSGLGPIPRIIRFKHSNLCLLVKNQATADSTPLVQGTCPAVSDFAKGFDLVE